MEITVQQDGDQWCALTGPNLQDGVAGFSYSIPMALRELADALETQAANAEPATELCDELIESMLTEYLALRDAVKRYEEIKKQLKPLFEGQTLVLIGRYKITGTQVDRNAYEVPASSYWNWRILAR